MKIIEEFPDYGIDEHGTVWSFKRPIAIPLEVSIVTSVNKTVKLCKNGVYYTRAVDALRRKYYGKD